MNTLNNDNEEEISKPTDKQMEKIKEMRAWELKQKDPFDNIEQTDLYDNVEEVPHVGGEIFDK